MIIRTYKDVNSALNGEDNPQIILDDDLYFMDEEIKPFYTQLLKWIGNKQRYAHKIANHFPKKYKRYYEPFLGSGSMLSVVSPNQGLASDISTPLIGIWQALKEEPDILIRWYFDRYSLFMENSDNYYKMREKYNENNNSADLLFLTRSCYGGVMRFRKADGFMSTPIGTHEPITPYEFARRVQLWRLRISRVEFMALDYKQAMSFAGVGDIVYCDPPYNESQNILYGSHTFNFNELLDCIEDCKYRGATVALSIDSLDRHKTRKDIFENIIQVPTGNKMLNNFHNSRSREERSEFLLLTKGEYI